MINTTTKMLQNGVDSAHKIWLAGLGTVDMVQEEGTKMTSKMTTKVTEESKKMADEGNKLFDRLVERGRGLETSAKKELEKGAREVETKVNETQSTLDRRITEALHRFGIPTRTEIQTLTSRVEELNAKVALMVETQVQTAAAAKKASARTVYHVTTAEEGWKVLAEGTKEPIAVANTKDEAVTTARDMAKAVEPSQVVVHKMDGTIQTSYAYGE
jgi:poly(hydroxyalkanoate) granule-associated protein